MAVLPEHPGVGGVAPGTEGVLSRRPAVVPGRGEVALGQVPALYGVRVGGVCVPSLTGQAGHGGGHVA